ncbi:MAG: hypothetical protein ACOY0T_38325 [Myxococcota bacterium]
MQISFEKFMKITALLAGSASIASGCTIETTSGGVGGVSGSNSSQGGSLPQGSSEGGTANAGNGGAVGGSNAARGGSTGQGGDDTVVGGTWAIGGASGSDNAGGDDHGGAGGLTGEGGAGGAPACLSGAPAEEGGGFDCSTLPFAADTCPNPSGEGANVLVTAMEICERYAAERRQPVELLTNCLAALGTTGGLCTAPAATAARACETAMQLATCASSEARSACAAIQTACGAISEADCVRDLSPLGADHVAQVKDCVVTSTSTQCAFTYRECRGLPTEAIDVAAGCTEIITTCPALPRATCESALNIYGTGKLLDVTYYHYRDCMAKSTSACATAFDTCTNP